MTLLLSWVFTEDNLATLLVHREDPAVTRLPDCSENFPLQEVERSSDFLFLSEKLSSLTENNFLSIPDQSYVLLKVENLINFSLPTVLSRDLESEVRVVLSTHTREKYITLFFPLLRISLQTLMISSLTPFLERISLNSSMGLLMISSTVKGMFISMTSFWSLDKPLPPSRASSSKEVLDPRRLWW